MNHHAWSVDPAGQAAIRRAEDGRTDAVPTLEQLFAAVPWRTELESASKLAPGANVCGGSNQEPAE